VNTAIRRVISTACLLTLTVCAHAQASHASHASPSKSPAYAIGATYSVAGEGRWDLLAVDSERHHIFLSRSDHVQVVDTRNGQVVATLAGTDGVHGFAIAPSLHRGFATDGRANAVTEFDLVTLQRVRDIKVSGQSPDAALFDPVSGRVFVFNAKSNNASVIDPASGKEVATIAFAGNPELGVSDGHGHVFVNIEDKGELVEIDSKTMQAVHTWELTGCEEPTGLAMDVAHARLFSVCQNRTMVITDAGSGRQVARVAIDDGPDGAEFDAQAQSAFSANGKSGTLTVVHEDDAEHFHVAQTLATQASARTIALDPQTHRLYLPAARFAPQAEGTKERPSMLPESFSLLMVEDAAAQKH
jgi:YVTN family beta-propeller protein